MQFNLNRGVGFVMTVIAVLLSPSAWTASTSYTLGAPSNLLDDSFYAGGSRAAWGSSLNHAGTTVAFYGVEYPSVTTEIYLVELGDPSSWRKLTTGYGNVPQVRITWTPDDSALYAQKRIDAASGIITSSGSTLEGFQLSGLGLEFTSRASGNWMIVNSAVQTQVRTNLVAVPVLVDGTQDPARQSVALTHFDSGALRGIVVGPAISAEGSVAAFCDFGASGGPAADISDVYVLKDLQAIMDAPRIGSTQISTLAPTNLSDPRIVPIRAGVVPDNFANSPAFSQDGSVVLFNEDWNNVFRNQNFIGSIASANFDIMLAKSNGSGAPYRFAEAGNQGLAHPTRGGMRVSYVTTNPAGAIPGFENVNFRLYMATLDAATSVADESEELPEGSPEVLIGGQPQALPPEIVLTDSAIQLTAAVEASDASGTSVLLPADQVVNFPAGTADKSIVISTPISPVTPAELPPGGSVDAIPVIREFGPPGTQFYPPVAITIRYTDAEIAGLNEGALRPFLYNADSGRFDIPVPIADIVSRDVENNTITFLVSHFSTYGLGGAYNSPWPPDATLPATRPHLLALTVLVMAFAGWMMVYRRRNSSAGS